MFSGDSPVFLCPVPGNVPILQHLQNNHKYTAKVVYYPSYPADHRMNVIIFTSRGRWEQSAIIISYQSVIVFIVVRY